MTTTTTIAPRPLLSPARVTMGEYSSALFGVDLWEVV